MSQTIIFIHGMFQNKKSWNKWIEFFSAKGYNCIAESWPDHEGDPAQLRANPPAELGDLLLDDVITSMETLVLKHGGDSEHEHEKPIVIGHSVGGLITQILANRGYISLGVPICSVAPNKMITIDWPFFQNVAAIANPFKGDKPFEQTEESFHKAFCNTLTVEEAKVAFELTCTHDSRNVLRGCLGSSGHVELDKEHVPLLFISAKEDQIVPTELVEKNSKAYDKDSGVTGFREFENRSHYICGERGWEEVAAYIENWLQDHSVSVEEGTSLTH